MANSHDTLDSSELKRSLESPLLDSQSSEEKSSHIINIDISEKFTLKLNFLGEIVDEDNASKKSYFDPSTKEFFWNAQATGWGTAGWMAVYYLKDFCQFWKLTGYFLIGGAMGLVANLVALPFEYIASRTIGDTKEETIANLKKYFWFCFFPDAFYESTADLFIALCRMKNIHDFNFVPYADPQFTLKERGAAVAFFGVLFGLVSYAIKKKYFKEELSEAENEIHANTKFLKFLQGLRKIFEGPAADSIKLALQYVMFYSEDEFFDTDLGNGIFTFRDLVYTCLVMGAFSFATDYSFKKIADLIRNLEKHIYENQLVPLDDGRFIPRKQYISLNDDYVEVVVEKINEEKKQSVAEKFANVKPKVATIFDQPSVNGSIEPLIDSNRKPTLY